MTILALLRKVPIVVWLRNVTRKPIGKMPDPTDRAGA